MGSPDFEAFLRKETDALLASDPELYCSPVFQVRVRDQIAEKTGDFVTSISEDLSRWRGATSASMSYIRPAIQVLAAGSVVMAVLFVARRWGWSFLREPTPTFLTYLTACLLFISIFIVTIVGTTRQRADAKNALRQKLRTPLKAEILSIINGLNTSEAAWSATLDTRSAPTLVEIDTLETVSSQTFKSVRDFITGHASSAIGVAGPRGAGKSTLMRQLGSDRSLGAKAHGLAECDRRYRAIQISAPVYYRPTEFTRLIHSTLVNSVISRASGTFIAELSARARFWLRVKIYARLLGMLLFTGLVICAWLLESDSNADVSGSTSDLVKSTGHLDISLLLLLTVTAAFAGWTLHLLWQAFWSRTWTLRPTTLQQLCQQQLEYLQSSTTRETTSTGALRVGRSGFEGGEKLTRTEREAGHAESVQALRQFLNAFVRLSGDAIVICIDELDKVVDPRKAVAAINGIKDLFHIPDVHFVVSVSTDAMHSFAARGVPVRDVFDSSFDLIIRTSMLDVEESRDLISRRAREFSNVFVLFCHAWSGGLARDLIRTARACVAQHPAMKIDEVTDAVLRKDLEEIVEASLDKLRDEPSGDTTSLLKEVMTFRDLLEERSAPIRDISDTAFERLPNESATSPEAQRLSAALGPYVTLAGLCSRLFSQPFRYQQWQSLEVKAAVQAIAQARASLGELPDRVENLVKRAGERVEDAVRTVA